MSIAENISEVRANIEAACREAGRSPEEITLVGASKMNDAQACREAIAAGIDALGENRVQEMTAKLQENAYEGAPLHFIGHLQRNKVRQVVGVVSLIHSVSSLELLEEIDKQARKRDIVQDILLEVNIGGEASKSGVSPDALPELLEEVSEMEHLHVCGLMTIPPPTQDTRHLEAMQKLFEDMNARKIAKTEMKILSMGMSGDYEAAVACGSTLVRIGSALFGARLYL